MEPSAPLHAWQSQPDPGPGHQHGATPLVHAAQKGEQEMLVELLSNGAEHDVIAHGFDRSKNKVSPHPTRILPRHKHATR